MVSATGGSPLYGPDKKKDPQTGQKFSSTITTENMEIPW